MGAQIAEVVSYAGVPVLLADRSRNHWPGEASNRCAAIYQARVDKSKMTPEQLEEKMLLVTPRRTSRRLNDVDLVIEAVLRRGHAETAPFPRTGPGLCAKRHPGQQHLRALHLSHGGFNHEVPGR
jgi:hypothetical protein